jgi:Bacterial mobilisation protein (MobC)/Protein of unknown function (DUF1778)
MIETVEARRRRLSARLDAQAETRDPLPDKIFLPDQSQLPVPPVHETGATGGRGRHFGGRRVETPRSARLDLRVTEDEDRALRLAAAAAGMTLTTFLCWRALGGERPGPRLQGADVDMLRKLLAQMGKQGSNLNQLAHHLNSCEGRELEDEVQGMRADHAAALAEHHAVCVAIMTALGV